MVIYGVVYTRASHYGAADMLMARVRKSILSPSIILVCGLTYCAVSDATAAAPPPLKTTTEWDDQALDYRSAADRQLYRTALGLVSAVPLTGAPANDMAYIFITTSQSDWIRRAVAAAVGADGLPDDAISLTVQTREPGRPARRAIAVFWDRILASEDPLAALILALATELHGTLTLHPNHSFPIDHILVYRNVVHFLRELPQQRAYDLLESEVRADLTAMLDVVKESLREAQAKGRFVGLCSALLTSQDN